jgi:hypothetical protein
MRRASQSIKQFKEVFRLKINSTLIVSQRSIKNECPKNRNHANDAGISRIV